MTEDRYFTCAKCDGVFKSDWPESNAIAEYRATFLEVSFDAPKMVLCEDCYLLFLRWMKTAEH